MRVGMNLLLWTTHVTERHEATLAFVKECGFDCVEVPIFEGDPDHYAKLGRICDRLGLQRTCSAGMAPEHYAEPLMRECLRIREATQPDAWTTFNAKSMLGHVCLSQHEVAEAEPLLPDGYRGMKEREARIPPASRTRIVEALERLVQLYEAKGNSTEATAWRSKLEAERSAPDGSRE